MLPQFQLIIQEEKVVEEEEGYDTLILNPCYFNKTKQNKGYF